MEEQKQVTPDEMLQQALTEFSKTHTRADVFAAIEFLVLIGILPQGYTVSMTFGTPQTQETEAGKEE